MALTRILLLGAALVALGGVVRASTEPVRTADKATQRKYDTGDFTGARLAWQQAADAGDAEAAYRVGLMYDLGQGVPSDATAAYGWYRRAAERGVPAAEFNVAVMADWGRGTAHDPAIAASWYARAAAHGLARAAYDLAQLYAAGEGVPRNPEIAASWLRAASARIPAAIQRVERARADLQAGLPQQNGQVQPAAPLPAPASAAGLGNRSATAPLELVWTAPAQSVPVRYVATVLARQGSTWTQVASQTTTVSALIVPPVPGIDCYAWRVYAVGTVSPHYTPGPWQHIGCDNENN